MTENNIVSINGKAAIKKDIKEKIEKAKKIVNDKIIIIDNRTYIRVDDENNKVNEVGTMFLPTISNSGIFEKIVFSFDENNEIIIIEYVIKNNKIKKKVKNIEEQIKNLEEELCKNMNVQQYHDYYHERIQYYNDLIWDMYYSI